MNRKSKIACALCIGTGLLAPLTAFAEVKSLTSSELTETYIKDSTIIITPKQKQKPTKKKAYSSLTIAPIDNNDSDIEQLNRTEDHLSGNVTSFALAEEYLRNASVESALTPEQAVEIESYQESITLPVAELLNDPRYAVPEDDFDLPFIGDDLGLSRTGDQLTFSIGNIPGIEQIVLPQGIDEAPLKIVPRLGGGFDLTFNIPQDN